LPSEDELVRAAQGGDREALDRLLRMHAARITAICRRLAGNDADAADASQEALIAIVRGLERFDGRSAFSTWAHRVATNACLDELRRRNRRATPTDLDELSELTAPSPEAASTSRIDIEAALAKLPLEFRAAVVLRDLSGLDYAEIASVLDVPVGTVRSRIARGRAALAALLEPGNPFPSDERPTQRP
jgi:RNA polymerase sigma-70 factor, ECF subfamily